VIGEDTHQAVRHLFACRGLGKVTLKGKQNEVTAYEVLNVQLQAEEAPYAGGASREA